MISMKTVTLNGIEVFPMPWKAQCPQPWPNGYTRVVIPYVRSSGIPGAHILIVRNQKLITTSVKFKPKKVA